MNRRDVCTGIAAGIGQSLLLSGSGTAMAAGLKKGSDDIARLTIAAASRVIHAGELSCVDVTRACLARIDAANPRINAVITTMRAQALAQAARLDAEAKAGKFRSPLHGIPIALKDNIDTADAPTTNASGLLKDHVPAKDARVVEMLRQAGAVIIAKANMAEFAVSPTNATSYFGPVRNPANPAYVSGGSSGGSAAATAAGMCFGALGTDSGGSIRLPSAWCGTVGLKPTLGLVPTSGVGPGIPIIDTTGPIARTVEDVALLLGQITGYDPLDPMSVERPREDYVAGLSRPLSALRVGIPRRPFFDGVDGQIGQAVETALAVIARLVGNVKDVAFDRTGFPEGPFTAPDLLSYHNAFFPARADGYQPRTRAIMKMLNDMLNDPATGSTAQKLANHAKILASIARRQRTIDAAFDGFDVIVLPTMKSLPPTVKAAVANESGAEVSSLFSIENTMTFNVLGLPALSIPCGYSREGLPISLMIAGPHFSESTLLALGAAYERATSWHTRIPV
jgi:aspartyl-tRNA(Asn)/glutamyl-tRNA(Gln) amidotransferase subunit A